MRLKVKHLTNYEYENQVFLGVHFLYLIPQYRPHFKILESSLTTFPTSENQSIRQDLAGNFHSLLWFNELTKSLKIESHLLLEVESFNPFSFLVDEEFYNSCENGSSPKFHYIGIEKDLVSYYIFEDYVEEYQSLIQRTWNGKEDLVGFLVRITAAIHEEWEHIIRHERNFWLPKFTFFEKKGSCRDLAWMMMNILGNIGLATKFVSGYAFNPELKDGHELHAWLEVFLPGAGWIGLDPSLGLLTDHNYIPLASHAKPTKASPVQGTYTGKGGSELTTHVEIQILSS